MKKLLLLVFILTMCACASKQKQEVHLIDASSFDTVIDGRRVELFTLKGKSGMTAQITSYGARVVALWITENDGRQTDVVWGYPTIGDYVRAIDIYSGAVVGRYANRISSGGFWLDSVHYPLKSNNGKSHLHGGENGFYSKVWQAVEGINDDGEPILTLSYTSSDGEQGYPGALNAKVVYTIADDNTLYVDYYATADRSTVVNLSSHICFNLSGQAPHGIDSHLLTINADSFTPIDSLLIPTGEIVSVAGTPFDFRRPMRIGARIHDRHIQMIYGHGYDHNYVLKKEMSSNKKIQKYSFAAEVYEPSNGVVMEIYTDQPALHFYGGNFMDGMGKGKRGERDQFRSSFTIMPQNYPDAPNHANFPSSVLRQGETYQYRTAYRFYDRK